MAFDLPTTAAREVKRCEHCLHWHSHPPLKLVGYCEIKDESVLGMEAACSRFEPREKELELPLQGARQRMK